MDVSDQTIRLKPPKTHDATTRRDPNGRAEKGSSEHGSGKCEHDRGAPR